ncbi:DUF485 domain-containing protein [Amycolatopsis anabasis]|uniref:DUF485 domain-containing protein n=1 Tax=Amycolatopsis anabasis TaxID=1840409 RepID=UPI00131E7BF4|nr:DUF485 domain-containing protein [Amycolatopsis anabasis]
MQNVAHSPATRSAVEDTGQLPVMFGRATEAGPAAAPAADGPDFEQIQRSDQFKALRSRLRRFVFPMSLLFVVWYMTYVVLAAYAHDFMSTRVFGVINVGMLLGLLQFVTTILIMAAYLRYAKRHIDPRVAEIRRQAGVPEK